MRAPLLCSLFLLAIPLAQADEQLRSTQEELRRRNLYFGDIDGRPTHELGEALKRFQQRKGFNATGRADPSTLRLLGLLPHDAGAPAPRAVDLPDEPVLKSDIQISPANEARAVSQETGVSLSELDPVGEHAAQPASKRPSPSLASRQPIAGTERGFRQAPPTRGVGLRGQPVRARTQQLNPALLAPLVRGYLRAASGRDTREELRYLADRVDYLGFGLMDRRVIEHTLRAYYLRWPKRSYQLAGPVDYRHDTARGVFTVTCTVDFKLSRGQVKASGRVQTRYIFDAATSDPRIIGIQEERVRTR